MRILNLRNVINGKGAMFKNDVLYGGTAQTGEMKPNAIGLMSNRGSLGHASSKETEMELQGKIASKMQLMEALDQEIQHKRDYIKNIDKQIKPNPLSLLVRRFKSLLKYRPEISVKNIKSFVRAQKSVLGEGNVSLEVYQERKKICGKCPHREHVDGYTDELGFCTKCGCGANPKAQLTVKLKIPKTSCPINKWDESKGTGDTLWFRIKYILTRRFYKND
jgi:hypothetical protein